MKQFNVGDFVIVNDCDAPKVHLIAIIIAHERGEFDDPNTSVYKYCYISEKTNMRFGRTTSDRATKLSEFGRRVYFYKSRDNQVMASVEISNNFPTATYDDGEERFWQDEKNAYTFISKDAIPYILSSLLPSAIYMEDRHERKN